MRKGSVGGGVFVYVIGTSGVLAPHRILGENTHGGDEAQRGRVIYLAVVRRMGWGGVG